MPTFFGWAVCKPWFFWFLLQGMLHTTWVVRWGRPRGPCHVLALFFPRLRSV